MKKVIILALPALLGSIIACSSEDSTKSVIDQERNYLIGKWNATSTHIKVEMDGKIVTDNLNEKGGSMYGIIKTYEFKSDNTVDYYTYIPSTETNEATESKGTSTYERNENQLIIKDYNPESYTILELSNDKLHLYNIFEVKSENSFIKTESIDKFERIK